MTFLARLANDSHHMRYRYRAYPTPEQAHMLAKTFGCARVVYNDAIRIRDAAHVEGMNLSDSEVEHRVIVLAKKTPEREWLGEVSSQALTQACQDARGAYRNYFASLSGKRKGRKIRHPRFRSRKNNRQSIRFGRVGFGVTSRGARLAKIGDIELAWSRDLPSVPSSVTFIREADGRYYASFVVEVQSAPLPHCAEGVGVDLGLNHLAVLSTGEKVANPRHLRSRQRSLARAQRSLARKQKGSANRRKAVRRVAVQHRKVRETRLDHHHKFALRLVRDNQAIYLEDLAISGLSRTRMARSVHDAGWTILVSLIEQKAAHCHRQVVKVGRWFPSSQLCSACGYSDGPKPLSIRAWTCSNCGVTHDRDVNAAKNILIEGRNVAAGLAETQNACGVDVRPGFVSAVDGKAGTCRHWFGSQRLGLVAIQAPTATARQETQQ